MRRMAGLKKEVANQMIPLAERFETKYIPEPNSGCWLWIGGQNEHGYGIIGVGGRKDGVAKAHRVSWELNRGKLSPGDNVLHKCDNPSCVNPDHLFIGSLADNSRDCVKKGRNFTPDNRGERATWAKLSAEDVREIRKKEKTGPEYAKMFGCSKSAIYMIWCGHNWASIE